MPPERPMPTGAVRSYRTESPLAYIKIMKNTDNTGYNPPPWESFSYKQ